MRKIPREYENPIDNVLLDWADMLLPYLKAANLTPNQITLGSIAAELGSLWALWYEKPAAFAVLFFIGVFLDYVDGHYARTYNMVTKFGDMLDHVSDVLSQVAIVVIICIKVGWPKCITPVVIAGLASLAAGIHLGCQQKYYRKISNETESLDNGIKMCRGPETSWLKVTRYVGVGTQHVIMIALVYYYVFHHK